jgi:hypothetical protein
MEHKVVAIAVLRSGMVYHNTITVQCADRNDALNKARRMLELWKGADAIRECLTYFADDAENLAGNEMSARVMLQRAQAKGWLTA